MTAGFSRGETKIQSRRRFFLLYVAGNGRWEYCLANIFTSPHVLSRVENFPSCSGATVGLDASYTSGQKLPVDASMWVFKSRLRMIL
jgi:hypothetical protein